MDLTHIDEKGRPKMVDVGDKENTDRVAIAKGSVYMEGETIARILEGTMKKGDVLSVAQVAGIMAAKKTSNMIPMCHNIFLTGVEMDFDIIEEEQKIEIQAEVKTVGKTGVEMEALMAVSTAALTIYDMCKAIDKGILISDIRLIKKDGGKTGLYMREETKL